MRVSEIIHMLFPSSLPPIYSRCLDSKCVLALTNTPFLVYFLDALPGSFAVWSATEQAEFLHGRFVWSGWDVNELSTGELRKRIDQDPYFLRLSVGGLNGPSGGQLA